jgi:dCTP deaminase
LRKPTEHDGAVLTDREIRLEVQHGNLISEGFVEANLHGCTYEFTVGEIAYRYDYEEKNSRQERAQSHSLFPFESVAIVTAEKVQVDKQHFLFLYSKGSLFSLGLVPVCTGADPGFSGHLGITITNLSARPVVLPVGTRLVKGVFFRLSEEVEKHYVGQHGDATMDWPYPSQFHADHLDPHEYARHSSRFLPAPVAAAIQVTNAVSRYLRWTIATLLVVASANVVTYVLNLLTPKAWTDKLLAILGVVGAIASVIGLGVSLFALWTSQRSPRS